MEQKSLLMSALGVGVGVGIGLASGQNLGKWGANSCSSNNNITAEKIEQEMLRSVVDGRETNVNFDQFPYYLRSPSSPPYHLLSYIFLLHSLSFFYVLLFTCFHFVSKFVSFPVIMDN